MDDVDSSEQVYVQTKFSAMPYDLIIHFWVYIILGVLCGVISGIFNISVQRAIWMRDKLESSFKRHLSEKILLYRLLLTFTVAVMTGTLQYFGGMCTKLNLIDIVDDMFNSVNSDAQHCQNWFQNSIIEQTGRAFFVIFTMAVTNIILPIPAGVLLPTLAIGATFGRSTLFNFMICHKSSYTTI